MAPPAPVSATSPALLADLALAEGLRLRAYQDEGGVWTVGYGHAHVKRGAVWTKAKAVAQLKADILAAEAECDRRLPWWRELDPVRRDAVCELMFNMGWGDGRRGLSTFKNTLAAMRERRWESAAVLLLASKWARQVKAGRAQRVAAQLRTGERRSPAAGA